MLSREVLGVFALGVLWLNSILVMAAALKSWGAIRALRKRLEQARRDGSLIRGEVRSDRLALRRVQQIGRAITLKGPQRILFTDGPQSFEVLGGEIETESGPIQIDASTHCEVWTTETREEKPSAADFEKAYAAASTNKGFTRELTLEIRRGDGVWVCNAKDSPVLVSRIDPIAFYRGRSRLIWLFVLAALAILIGCTAIALWPPYFGVISTVGGAACLLYFIIVQPLGTAVRDRVRAPSTQPIGGLWEQHF